MASPPQTRATMDEADDVEDDGVQFEREAKRRTLQMGLHATTKIRKHTGATSEHYEISMRSRNEATGKEMVSAIIEQEREMEQEAERRREAEGNTHAPRGDWHWVEGAHYWMNVATGERSWAAPDLPVGSPASSPVGSPASSPAAAAEPDTPAPPAPPAAAAPPPAVPLPDRDMEKIQSVAEAYGYAAAVAVNEDRDRALTIELRRANNFLKDGPIRVCLGFWSHVIAAQHRARPPADPRVRAAPRLEVLDLCCGRGQDFDKYRRACRDSLAVLSKLVGVDVAGIGPPRHGADPTATHGFPLTRRVL